MPTGVLASPGSWLEEEQRRIAARTLKYQEYQHDLAASVATIYPGASINRGAYDSPPSFEQPPAPPRPAPTAAAAGPAARRPALAGVEPRQQAVAPQRPVSAAAGRPVSAASSGGPRQRRPGSAPTGRLNVGTQTHSTPNLARPASAGVPAGVYDRAQGVPVGGYDPSKHGWYHPQGQAEQSRLEDPAQSGSYAWMIQKANDHSGYSGTCTKGVDVQRTAISGDAPAWLVGVRMVPGPFGSKKHPVRRCPVVTIEGKQLCVRGKRYEQGACLDAIEHWSEQAIPPQRPPGPPPAANLVELSRRRFGGLDISDPRASHLEHGGCQRAPEVWPSNMWLGFERP